MPGPIRTASAPGARHVGTTAPPPLDDGRVMATSTSSLAALFIDGDDAGQQGS
jgi:hypothetical protein